MISKEEYKTVTCPPCGGGRFSGYGSGYDSVCDTCGGQGEILEMSDDAPKIEEMGMTISLLEADLLHYKSQVEALQKEVDRLTQEHEGLRVGIRSALHAESQYDAYYKLQETLTKYSPDPWKEVFNGDSHDQ